MQKIDPKNQINVTKNSLATILAEYGIHDFKYKEIKSGAENTTVKITTPKTEYVLRVYRRNKKTNQDINLEIEFQEYLRRLKIPIPTIYKNTKGKQLTISKIKENTWQCLLMEYIGESDFSKYTKNLISSLATTQATMHLAGIKFAKKVKKHTPIWDQFKEEIVDKNPGVEVKGRSARAFVTRAKKFKVTLTSNLEHGYNHLDLDTSGNIIIQNNQIQGIIDFDDLAYSACIACLAFTLWHIIYVTKDVNLAEKYIEEYERTRFLTKNEKSTIPKMLLFRTYEFGMIELFARNRQENLEKILKTERLVRDISFVKQQSKTKNPPQSTGSMGVGTIQGGS